MNRLNAARFILSISMAATVLVGCEASRPIGVPDVIRQAQSGAVRPDRGKSWMKANASQALLYFDDDVTNDTYVYDYPSGKLVGKLTGFHDPQGMCVDKKGDVYITNSQFGLLFEYAHGGTEPMNVYEDPGDRFVGCSVSATGDVAATGGNICIWKHGVAHDRPTCIDGNKSMGCVDLSTFGYDHVGDLIGLGTTSLGKATVCMIRAGNTTMEKLSTSGIKFNFGVRGTAWDGQYITLGGTGVNGDVVQPAKLSGTTLVGVGPEIRLDDCPEMPGSPFFFGKHNLTAASTTRATSVTVANPRCDKGVADVWNYPKAGHEPILRIRAEHDSGGDAVSIAQ